MSTEHPKIRMKPQTHEKYKLVAGEKRWSLGTTAEVVIDSYLASEKAKQPRTSRRQKVPA